jgi:hypothetical protein
MTLQFLFDSPRTLAYRIVALGSLLSALGCGAKQANEGVSSSQTHWLKYCQSDAECGSLSCIAAVCNKTCSERETCLDLSASAVCREGACAKSSSAPTSSATTTPTATPTATATATANNTPLKLPAGANCSTASECQSDVCEGEGCGEAQGKCADENKACTTDARAFAGVMAKRLRAAAAVPEPALLT